jgi:hypothetical protein
MMQLYCTTLFTTEKFKLITTLYNETNPIRAQEYIACLEKNLQHQDIDDICVLYDTSKDSQNSTDNYVYTFSKNNRIKIVTIHDRPTYGYCFDIANTLFPNSNIILSNADIYFNQTLSLLNNYNLANKFLVLTRWNITPAGLKIFKQYCRGEFQQLWSELSQDVWIFQTPIKHFPKDDFKLGTMQCDSFIAYQATISGLTVLNPCLSIQCCHLHLSGIRNYNPLIDNQGTGKATRWQEL